MTMRRFTLIRGGARCDHPGSAGGCLEGRLTVAGAKYAFGIPGIVLVGIVCDSEGRRPEERRVQRIVTWPVPRSVKDARAFVVVCVYDRIFIAGFSIIIASIIVLFRKGATFEWTEERQAAMDLMKRKLTEAPVLIALDFSAARGGHT